MSAQYMEELHTSTKNVYLIASDLHRDYRDMNARYSYKREITHVENKILTLAKEYKSRGYNTFLIFLGDVFNRSYRDVEEALSAYSEMMVFNRFFNGVYSVIGNHEVTYYKNNPFWHLVSDVKTNKVIKKRPVESMVKGVIPFIKIVDRLIDGDVEFIFNHHSTGVAIPNNDKTSIGLFHQDIVFREILDEAKSKNRSMFELDEETMKKEFGFIYLENKDFLNGYHTCFFGHLHKLYGEWNNDGLILHYLASLGRTNHTEVVDDFLERNIPAIIVEDGKFIRKEDNLFNLMDRVTCVDEEVIERSREKYEVSKERQEIKKYVGHTDNPVESLKSYFNEPIVDTLIDEILNNRNDSLLEHYRDLFRG